MTAFNIPPRPDFNSKKMELAPPGLLKTLAQVPGQSGPDQAKPAPTQSEQSKASTSNAVNASDSSVTPDQLLYSIFSSLSQGQGQQSGDQTSFRYGLRPEDASYANALYNSNPLAAVQSVSSYATVDNFLGSILTSSGGGSTGSTSQPSNFNAYKANMLGSISPENAINMAQMLAGPILQGGGQS